MDFFFLLFWVFWGDVKQQIFIGFNLLHVFLLHITEI